jgi:hypothetical protein|tara:strand:- start:54 stop:251 length:198 start_codon:yes stop_codon:yes gene_type:complete
MEERIMEIDLTEKQCRDIEWSILIAVDSVQQRYLKEKKEIDTPLTRKLWKLHDYIQKTREKVKVS